MKVGILKDIKVGENRVIATPVEISSLTADGHEVLVQKEQEQGRDFRMKSMLWQEQNL